MAPEIIDVVKVGGPVAFLLFGALWMIDRRRYAPRWYMDQRDQYIARLEARNEKLEADLAAERAKNVHLLEESLFAASAVETAVQDTKQLVRRMAARKTRGASE